MFGCDYRKETVQICESSNVIVKISVLTFFRSEIWTSKFLSENRFYVCISIFWNTGPISIIFGSLESKKIELSFFLGIAMLPLTSIFAVLVAIHSCSVFISNVYVVNPVLHGCSVSEACFDHASGRKLRPT